MSGPELRTCNECGETYPDPGHEECPFCQSDDTNINDWECWPDEDGEEEE